MNDATNPANRPDAANYMKLFPEDRTRCAPGALMSNDSRLAYLVHLKELIQAFEVRADVNAPITLLTRRPDLLTLKLDDRNARRTLPKIRITLELLENRAQQALAKNQTLQAAVAQGSGQASVPFHRAWESVKAALAAKQVQLWDLLSATSLCYPLFTFAHLPSAAQRTATTLASGFSPQLRTLLLDATPSELMLSATAYDTTRKLAKALALSRRELRQLLAVEAVGKGGTAVTRSPHVPTAAKPSSQVYGAVFINNGATPLYLLESAPAQPATKKIVRIEGLTDAHLDRLQRILRLQRALGLSAAQTDTLVMAALRAEGQTGNYRLTDKTLRALGLFRHLQQKYNVSAEQYAALIDTLSPHATGRQASFYDQLFAAGHDEDGQPAQPSLKLDDKAFDPASTTGADGLTVKQLALGLKVDDTLLRGILGRVVEAQKLQKPTRSLAVVSACYRIVALARVFGTSTLQGLSLIDVLMNQDPVYCQQLAGRPSLAGETGKADIVDVIAGMLQAVEWLQQQGMDALQLASLLNPRTPSFNTTWKNAFNLQASQNADALHLALKTALELESPNLVAPLLRWAGVDADLLSARIAAIAQQCTEQSTTPEKCFTESDFTQWSTLQRHSDVTKLFKLSAHLLDQLTRTPDRFDLKDQQSDKCRPLDLSTVYQLGRYKAVLARLALGMGEQNLLDYLVRFETDKDESSANSKAKEPKEHWAALEQLLGCTSGSLCALADIEPPETLAGIDRLLRTQELADKHGLAVDTLLQLGKLPKAESYAPFQQAAVALRKGCSNEQRQVADDQQNVAWRDALMQWMIANWAPTDDAHSWITSTQHLADYLLIDLQVSHEPLTTRTLSATASLQRYLHQIHSHLENGYRSTEISNAEREEWENFSSSYERWRLRQDAYNEPQNFIDPTRRQRKTRAFKDLETQLAQGKCQPDDIHVAMLGYLSTFETLSNIQPISVYADGTSPLTDTYHFIGKTNVEPTEFYWRTLDMSQRDQEGVPSMLAWGEWEKITLTVSATMALTSLPAKDHDTRTHIELIRPVIVAGRRYVVWVERDTTGIPMGPDSKPSEYFALRVFFAFQQTDGNWSPPNEFMTLDGHDEKGEFESSEVLQPNSERTAAGSNVYLKTRKFMPGLMVMVNIHGDRLHDPWLTTVVFDSSLPAEEGKKPKRNVDYFISTKDLLLLEDKALDLGNVTDRPIETNMVERWLSFFRDPRTVQHPYVGAVTRLKEVAEDSKAFNWSDLASTDQVKDRYEIATLGQALIKETLSYASNRISVDVTLDSLWTLKKDCVSITFDQDFGYYIRTVSINIYSLPFASHHKEKILSSSNLIALANSPLLDEQEQEHISSLLNKLDTLAEKIKNLEAQADKKHDEEIVKLQNEKEKNTKYLIQHLDENYKLFTLTSKITEPLDGFSFSQHNSITFNASFTNSDGDETITKLHSNVSPLLAPKQISLSILNTEARITLYRSSSFEEVTEDYLSALPKGETKPNPKSEFSELTIKLTSKPKENSNPSWTLSAFEQACLDEQHLQAFKTLPTDNADAFKTLKNFLLKVRYLPADQYSKMISDTDIKQPQEPTALHTAIDTAKARGKADVINTLIALELKALKAITSHLPDESLQAILRLRYLHPNTCRRILFYLDSTHEMVFEDTLIANGKGAVNFTLPINKDIRDYTVSLDVYDGEISTTDPIATATCAYTLEEKDDDAIPSVQICRNETQALYLDFKEVNNKAEDQTSAPPFRTLRLNTLFGKQLVALATQSVEQSLSWKAQHLPEPPLEPASSGTIVDLRSANGLYFWELFFHVPFLVTWLQRQNREYSQAWRWCTRFLFDPYRTWVPEGNHPPLFWLTRPLLARAAFTASAQTNDPDLLAYAEPERYRKALHLFVVENWQRQGDDQYRMLTLDSLVEAALCYDKALRLIGVLPEDLSSAPAQPPTLAEASSTAFTPPLNNKLVTLRNLLRNRLFNLRHGLTLDGKPAAIMLDPDTLDQIALGNSVAAQDRGEAAPVAPIVPPCRYEEARKCAAEAVQQLIALGQTLLGFYNTEAAQQLELLGKRNLIRLLDFPCQLQEQALELARRERETVVRSRAMIEQRQEHYQQLLVDEDISKYEKSMLELAKASVSTRGVSIPTYALAAGAAAIPTIFGMAVGGANPQEAFESAANATEALAETLETLSNTIDKRAEYILRRQQWQHEADQAAHELGIIDAQLRERDVQIKAAGIAVSEARATRQAHQAEYEVMQSVFASHTTYLWLIGRLSEIYSTAYDATLSLCLMAENCLQYELGDFASRWIRTDGWLDNWRGMLAGEALERDLMQMDVAAIRDNHRPLDIRKDFSLLELTGWKVTQLHEQLKKDEILFELSARLFDSDFPGHYLRRLERITLAFEIPGSGSSKAISAMLYQTSNKLLLEADIEGARHLYSASKGSPRHVLRDLRPNQSIALWSVKEVSRNFDLQPSVPDKARYQPFEGTGLISSWRLAFPGGARNNPEFYRDNECRLKDITITVSYSAVDGPTAFRDEVKQLLQAESTTGSAAGGDSAAGESPSGNGSSQPASSGNADNAIVTAREAEQAANAALATAQAQADNPALKAPEAAKQLKQVTEAIAKAEKAAEAASTARKNTEAAAKKGQVDSAQASADEAQKNAKSAREAAESAQNACKDAQDAAKAREAAAREAAEKAAQEAAEKAAQEAAEKAAQEAAEKAAQEAAEKAAQEAAEKAAQEAADKLKAEIATAVASAKAAAEAAEASQKSAQADYQATSMNIPEASAEKKEATGAMGKLQAAVDEAKKAYQDAEAAASEGELATAQAKARSAQEAAKRADSHAKTIAAIRKKTDTFQTLAQLQAAAKDLVGKQVQYAYKTGETYTAKVVSWAEDHVKFEGWGGGPATKMMFSSIAYLKAN
ncbi:neuraminidase-like domain-containing protein [Pseudomonas sp. MH2]|uniref:Neuraminidase-like domain-containing protein n=1 Tax=Pseudomonas machongensis TaxID=3110229 RepID=A0ABU5VL61_9PSED|nr:neuraminidase-like domain-containing protein [Pseudomonas sp. MH2]MEA5674109.1 neuraminidase-like domain-containing protein [Pseudomonas sp. MH2]